MIKKEKSDTKKLKKTTQSETSEKNLDNNQPKEKINWKEEYIYLSAIFENYKNHVEKQKEEYRFMAVKKFMQALLPILEDFEQGLNDKAQTEEKISKKGVQMLKKNFLKALLQQGLSEMKITEGDNFDPDYHEALTTVSVKNDKLKDKIVKVVAKGYLLDKKVIQGAKVIIAK